MASKSVRILACAAIAVAAAPHISDQRAQAAQIFAPKTITIIIASDTGGGTDTAARLVGRHLARYLPGQPSVVYLNIPGGGGIKGLNDFMVRAKPDGLMSAAGSASHIDPTTLRNPAVRYNAKELLMYGGFPAQNGVLSLRKDAAPRFHDKSRDPVVMGDVYVARHADQMVVWGPAYLGWNIRWVFGYKSTPEVVLAAIRGEIDMMCTYDANLLQQLDESGKFIAAVQTGLMHEGKLERQTTLPDVPTFSELIRPLLTNPQEISAFSAWEAQAQIAKWLALPPHTPEAIVRVYRDAFDKIVKDNAFLAEAPKVLGETYTTASGEDMQKIVYVADGITDDDLAFLNTLREKVGIRVE